MIISALYKRKDCRINVDALQLVLLFLPTDETLSLADRNSEFFIRLPQEVSRNLKVYSWVERTNCRSKVYHIYYTTQMRCTGLFSYSISLTVMDLVVVLKFLVRKS